MVKEFKYFRNGDFFYAEREKGYPHGVNETQAKIILDMLKAKDPQSTYTMRVVNWKETL